MAISVYSPTFDEHDSYGKVAQKLALGLHDAGIDKINRVSQDETGGFEFHPVFGGFVLGYPTAMKIYGNLLARGPKVALTMFESTQLPEGWVESLNTCDAVIVPAKWNKQVFESCGVTVPVYVVPLGVDDEFVYKKRNNGGKTVFLAIGDRDSRKGWTRAASAFYHAFGDDDDVELVIKCRSRNQLIPLSNPNIRVISEDYSLEQMVELYHQCHAMIFPSNAEGFGLPPREFAATGGISFATNYSGMADDIQEWGIPIPYSEVPAWSTHPNFKGLGYWADPDLEVLSHRLRTFKIWTGYSREQKGLEFARAIRSLYSWKAFAEGCLNVWQSVAGVKV